MKYGLVETKKLYFTSAEAAEQVGVPVKVLHSWEKDFPDLKPKKNKAGKRVYSQIDIETAKQISSKSYKGRKSSAPIGKTAPTDKAAPTNANNEEILLKIRNDLLKNFLRIHRN